MFLKRTSPILDAHLAGGLEIGDQNPFHNGEIVPKKREAKQGVIHRTCDGDFPKIYQPPKHHKNRIPFLEKAGKLIVEAFSNPFDFDIGHIFWHKDKFNKGGDRRKVRSERRESITLRIGRFIIHHINLATMALGFPKDNGFHSYTYESIAKNIGINLSEVKRSMALFIKEGYVAVEEVREKQTDGSYRSLAPNIKISQRLFYDLGFDTNEIRFHVERAEKKLAKEKAKRIHKEKKPGLFPRIKKQSKIARRALAEIMANLASKLNPNTS